MEKDGSSNAQRKEFAKLRRRVRAMERRGEEPPEHMKTRLVNLDEQLMETGVWYSNFKNER